MTLLAPQSRLPDGADTPTPPAYASAVAVARPARKHAALRELGVLVALYVAYAVSRIFADDALAPAVDRARTLLRLEHLARLDVEAAVNGWFVGNDTIGLLASYHYATAHYVVTAGVLLWLFRRDRPLYARARTALALATVLALAAYLLLPTAPPRLMAGWTDVLALHADEGWWGEAASAPQGMGWMTNQLAAFPSMHAGWALWVALAVSAATASRTVRTLAWAHAGLTALVVIGTGNHWVLDAVVGWFVVVVAFGGVIAWERRSPVVAHEDASVPV